MKNYKIIYIIVLVIVFIVTYSVTDAIMKSNKETYSCYDYTSDTYYTFKTEQEMHEVCDEFDNNNYTIYEELINTDDNNGYSFDPYVRDNELVIIVAITDCTNPEQTKEKVKKWFSDHSYDINNFKIEYENPCE